MKICVPICNRTNYSKLRPVLKLVQGDVKIIASSSILLEKHGNAIKDIIDDGFEVLSKVDCLMANDTPASTLRTLSISVMEHTSILDKHKFDALLVVGDRFDMLAPVLSANFMNLPILHIQGGEKTGCVDDTIRNIITVCSQNHYVATNQAAIKVGNMVGHSDVFHVGCPAVEAVSNVDVGDFFDIQSLKKKYKHTIHIAPYEDYFLVSVHPNSLLENDIDMDVIINTCLKFNKKCIVFYPNIDAHNSKILGSINSHRDLITLIKHAPFEDFVKFMAHAACLIGNSSSGIREAACFGTPVVNIGLRQFQRERNNNTIDVQCTEEDIHHAIQQSLKVGKYEKCNIYYMPNSSQKIANLIHDFGTRK